MTPTDYAAKAPATAATAAFVFYDIESLHNVFSVAMYGTKTAESLVFYLVDESEGLTRRQVHEHLRDHATVTRIRQANPALAARWHELGNTGAPAIRTFDLAEDKNARFLASVLAGVTEDDPHTAGVCSISGMPLVCDTSGDYDPTVYPLISGYNSNQYDTTMLALYFSLRFGKTGNPRPVSAATMRRHNDAIFELSRTKDHDGSRQSMTGYLREHRRAAAIRRGWISSGRHLDVARLNELQQKVALKRLLGMLGHQILESDNLSGPDARVTDLEDLTELLAYNVSDTVGTSLLMADPTYAGSFDLRAGLLRTYPETVFDHIGDHRTPALDTTRVLKRYPRNRLTIDTSSAQFAGRILAPYRDLREVPGHVADLPVVSFRYPDPLQRTGNSTPDNVLTETRDFLFRELPPESSPAARRAHEAFEKVYRYYRSIEGLSFNTQDHDVNGPSRVIGRIKTGLDTSANAAAKAAQAQRDPVFAALAASGTPTNREPTPQEQLRDHFIALFGNESSGKTTFTAREFNRITPGLIDWARGDVDREADVRRLRTIILALADSAQGYWPEERVQSPGDTVIEYEHDRMFWRNLAHELASVARPPLNVPYFDSHGEPTSCFATFSTGGIHGAEAAIDKYRRRVAVNDNLWPVFHAALAEGARQFDAACALVDGGHLDPEDGKRFAPDHPAAEFGPKMSGKTMTAAVTAGRAWIDGGAPEAMPEIRRPDGSAYSPLELAKATWWIRKRVRIDVFDPAAGRTVTVEWADVLKSSKASDPQLRPEPKGVVAAELFVGKPSSEIPLVPPDIDEHRDNRLDPRYRHTSIGDVIHEDFTSYYPLMLVNLGAFTNPDLAEPGGDPVDKYSQIFADKERYGKLMKDPSLTRQERDLYKVLREGTKLILNAASGAADARHSTPILMNNMIITMRIVGQLFSWRIGQAQTFAGGSIVSTNTDGLYSTLDQLTNQQVLDQHTEAIGVQIEPEPLTLVSKDSNNRVEFSPAADGKDPWDRVVFSAGGGTLACWDGPSPRKALAHPAMTDRLLLEYFKLIVGEHPQAHARVPYAQPQPLSIAEPMDVEILSARLDALVEELGVREALRFFQNLVASSPSAGSYLYAAPYRQDPDTGLVIEATDTGALTFPGDPRPISEDFTADAPNLRAEERQTSLRRPISQGAHPQVLGHYTRLLAVDPDRVHASGAFDQPLVIAAAKARSVSANVHQSRIERGYRPANPDGVDRVAEHLLGLAGEDVGALRGQRDLIAARHSGVDPSEPMLVFNHTIVDHPDEGLLRELLACVDRSVYVRMAEHSYNENWRNG